jgi:hypothetical protein
MTSACDGGCSDLTPPDQRRSYASYALTALGLITLALEFVRGFDAV